MLKVTYLKHSGFVVEYGECVLVFDYYSGSLPEYDEAKKIYVFASHAHYDHFQNEIFEWDKKYAYVRYILSDDITSRGPKGKVTYVGADKEVCIDDLRVRTLLSTDEGVAFLVYVKDKTIYHAGDLNWWYWEEEDDEEWNEPMRKAYQNEISKLADEKVDVAFVPLDLRQEKQFYWGMDYYMKHTDTKIVFPMHMWGYEAYDRLMENPESEGYRDRVMHITKPGQTFVLES